MLCARKKNMTVKVKKMFRTKFRSRRSNINLKKSVKRVQSKCQRTNKVKVSKKIYRSRGKYRSARLGLKQRKRPDTPIKTPELLKLLRLQGEIMDKYLRQQGTEYYRERDQTTWSQEEYISDPQGFEEDLNMEQETAAFDSLLLNHNPNDVQLVGAPPDPPDPHLPDENTFSFLAD
jgi:F0F1-type ATP synthase alpha subunit